MIGDGGFYGALFEFFHREHDLILLDSQIQEIIYEVNKFQNENKDE